MTSPSMTERDLALYDVLQHEPRASWASVGRRLHVAAPTARRQWERLRADGDVCVTTYAGPGSGAVQGLLDVQVRPGRVEDVAAALVRHPRAYTVSSMTGGRDLNVLVYARDMVEFRRVVQADLPGIDGIASTRASVTTIIYSDGADWVRDGGIRRVTRQASDAVPRSDVDAGLFLDLMRELEPDGRRPITELADRLAITPDRARSRLQHALDTGEIRQRVDLSARLSEWRFSAAFWLQVPVERLEPVAARMRLHPAVRLCMSLTGGPANLYVIAWLRSLREESDVESGLVAGMPAIVLDRSIIVHYHKRLGWLYDDAGSRVGHVSWVADPPATPGSPATPGTAGTSAPRPRTAPAP